jgi:hypothetical protein
MDAIAALSDGYSFVGLSHTGVTDEGLRRLRAIPRLGYLKIDGTSASGAALADFPTLSQVKIDARQAQSLADSETIAALNLVDADEDCVKYLGRLKLPRLEDVRFVGNRPSVAMTGAISRAFSNCKIDGKPAPAQPTTPARP